MSRTLRWVLGILAALVVVAVIAGAAWVWQSRSQMMTSYRLNAAQPNAQATPGAPNVQPPQNQQRGPQGFGDNRRYPMSGWGMRGPMMGDRRFSHAGPFMPFGMGFFFLGGLFRLIIPLVILTLVAVLFYQLGKRAGAASAMPPASAPSAPAAPPARKVAKS
jgi:hypothetical protein